MISLKELLVTIACVVLMGAVLGAGGLAGRQHAKGVVCITNIGGLARAWLLYAEDNDGWLVGGSTYNSTDYRWCERPLRPDSPMPIPLGVDPSNYSAGPGSGFLNHEARLRGIRAGWLFAYTGNERMYHCPSDTNYTRHDEPYSVFRTYAIAGQMNGEDFRTSTITLPDGGTRELRMARNISQIVSPAEKYVFVAEDVVNSSVHGAQWYNLGGFVMMAGNNYWRWWDTPAPWHNDSSTLGFADGHAEIHTWEDRRTLLLMKGESDPLTGSVPGSFQPNNEDIVYMNEGYFACD